MPRPDRKLTAALVLSAGIGLTSLQDALIKWVSGSYPFHQMQTIRCLVALPIVFAVARYSAGRGLFRCPRPGLLAFRSLVLASASTLFYLGLSSIPLATGAAIYFTFPLMVAVLSGPLIGERVPPRIWAAVAAGFGGVLVMVRPGGEVFEPAALLSLAATALYAVGHMLTRPLGETMRAEAMALYQCLAFLAVAGLLSAVFGSGTMRIEGHPALVYLTRGWSMPSSFDLAAIAFFGVLTAVGMFVYSNAYRIAPPSFTALFEYSSMIWAVGLGYLFFRDLPGAATLWGAALIVAAGLFIIAMERRAAVTPDNPSSP